MQSWLWQYSWRSFFDTSYCSFSNAVRLRSMRCWRPMILWKISTRFCKFERSVSVNDLWLLWLLEELPQALFCSLWGLVLHGSDWIYWVLNHDNVSLILTWFTLLVQDFVIRCNQITKLLRSWWSFASAPCTRSTCYFCSQADVAISAFWKWVKNIVRPWSFCHFRNTFRIYCVLSFACNLIFMNSFCCRFTSRSRGFVCFGNTTEFCLSLRYTGFDCFWSNGFPIASFGKSFFYMALQEP